MVEMANTDIKNIIFKSIDKDYSYGKYDDFEIIIMNSNDYMNATGLCNAINKSCGSTKLYRHWRLTDTAKELIEGVAKMVGTDQDSLFIKMVDVKNKLRGTYVHPLLIPHISSWASPLMAIKVSQIVNNYYSKKAHDEKQQIIIELECNINEKDDTITQLNKKVDMLLEKNKSIIKHNKKIEEHNKKIE